MGAPALPAIDVLGLDAIRREKEKAKQEAALKLQAQQKQRELLEDAPDNDTTQSFTERWGRNLQSLLPGGEPFFFGQDDRRGPAEAALPRDANLVQRVVARFSNELEALKKTALVFDPIAEAGTAALAKVVGKGATSIGLGGHVRPEPQLRADATFIELGKFFRGEISGPEVAGRLRENFEKRPFGEQLAAGVVFDPTILIPVGPAVKGAGAGVKAISEVKGAFRVKREFAKLVQEGRVPIGGASDTGGTFDEITKRLTEEVARKNSAEIRDTGLLLERLAKGDVKHLRDRAEIQLMLGTGSRPGPIQRMTVGELETASTKLDANIITDIIQRQKNEADQTRAVRVMEDSRERVAIAIREYIEAARREKKWSAKKGDAAFSAKGGSGKNPDTNLAVRLKAYSKEYGLEDLPQQAKLFRPLVARKLFLTEDAGGNKISRHVIAAQLGHNDITTTNNFYLREVGWDITGQQEEMLDALRGGDTPIPENITTLLRDFFKPDAKRTKGASFKFGEITELRSELGKHVAPLLPRPIAQAALFAKLREVDSPFASLYEEGLKLVAARNLVTRLGVASSALKARKQAMANPLVSAASDLPLAKADLAERTRDVQELRTHMNAYIQREGSDLSIRGRDLMNARKQYSPELNELLLDLEANVQISEDGFTKGKIVAAIRLMQAHTRKTLLAEGSQEAFNGMKASDDAATMATRITAWVNNPSVKTALAYRDLFSASTRRQVHTVIKKMANIKNVMGDAYYRMNEADQAEVLNNLATALFADSDLMGRFSAGPLTRAERRAARTKKVVKPKILPPRDDTPIMLPGAKQGIISPATSVHSTVIDLLHQVESVKPSAFWSGVADRAHKVSPGVGSTVDNTIAFVGGGFALIAKPAVRIVMGLMQGRSIAKDIGINARNSLIEVFKAADMELVPTGYKSGTTHAFRESDIQVIAIDPSLAFELASKPHLGDVNVNMRSMAQIMRIPAAEWRKYYIMRPDVYNAFVYAKQQIAEVEDLMVKARDEFGFDIFKHFKGKRAEAYWPSAVVGTGDINKLMKNDPTRIEQSAPFNFLDRSHDSYAQVLKSGDRLDNPLDSFAFYVRTVHEIILEDQAHKLIVDLPIGQGVIPSKAVQKQDSGASALGTVMADKRTGRISSGSMVERAEAFNPILLKRIYDSPGTTVSDELRDMVFRETKRANEAWQGVNGLRFRTLGPEWAKDLLLSERDWQQINRMTQLNTNFLTSLAKGAAPTAQTIRFMRTGVDTGAPLIHGFPVLIKDPKLWGRAVKQQFKAWHEPEVYRTWSVKNSPEKLEAQTQGGIVFGQSEPLEILQSDSSAFDMLRRGVIRGEAGIRKVVPLIGKHIPEIAGKKTGLFERFEASFNQTLDMMRVELWKSMKKASMGDDELRELGAVINKMTGTYNPALSGVSPSMRVIQSGLLFFAPMYRRAVYGTIVDIFRGGLSGRGSIKSNLLGGIRRKEALKRLGGLAVAGSLYGGIGMQTGNKDAFNPTTPRFMTIPIGQFNIGIGTAYYSLFRLGGILHKGITGTAEDLVNGTFGGDDILQGVKDIPDNRLTRWFRGQVAPTTALALDFYTGKTYIGEPLRDGLEPDIPTMIQHLGAQAAPFWLDAVFQGAFPAATGEFMGLRSFPLSVFSKARETRNYITETDESEQMVSWRDERVKEGKPITWHTLPRLYQSQLTEKHADLQIIKEEMKRRDLERGDEFDRRFLSFQSLQQNNRDTMNTAFENIQGAWDAGTFKDGASFRAAYSEALSNFRASSVSLADQFNDVIIELDEMRVERKKGDVDTFIGDIAFDNYMTDVIEAPDNKDEHDQFLIENLRRHQLEFDRRWDYDPDILKYVEDRRLNGRKFPPIIQAYEDAKDILEPYWSLHNDKWGDGSEQVNIVEHWLELKSSINRAEYERSSRHVKFIIKRWKDARLALRRRNRDIDEALVTFYDAQDIRLQRRSITRKQALITSTLPGISFTP